MDTYKLIVGCNLKQYETNSFEPTTYLALDVIKDRTVRSQSTIASQPMQTGDTISDHMYRDPLTYDVSGTFGLDSKHWENDFYTDGSEDIKFNADRLSNIQTIFEKIKNEGLLCTLCFIECDDDGAYPTSNGNYATRFLVRNNMALTSIIWTERLNTVNFQFQFKEIILVNNQEEYDLSDEEMKKYRLPSVNAPKGATLGQVISDTNDVDAFVAKILDEKGYITEEFKKAVMAEYKENSKGLDSLHVACLAVGAVLIAAGVVAKYVAAVKGVLVAVTALAIKGGAAAASSIVPVGTIVVGAAALAVGIALGVKKLVDQSHARAKAKKVARIGFNTLDDAGRFKELLDDTNSAIYNLDLGINLYNFSKNEAQQVLIKLDNEVFIIEAEENNTVENPSEKWGLSVRKSDDSKFRLYSHRPPVINDLFNLNSNISYEWFGNLSGTKKVYLYNPSLNIEYQNGDEDAVKSASNELTSYFIMVCDGDLQSVMKKLQKDIVAALGEAGYDD